MEKLNFLPRASVRSRILSISYRSRIDPVSIPYQSRIVLVSFSYRSPIVLAYRSGNNTETIRKRYLSDGKIIRGWHVADTWKKGFRDSSHCSCQKQICRQHPHKSVLHLEHGRTSIGRSSESWSKHGSDDPNNSSNKEQPAFTITAVTSVLLSSYQVQNKCNFCHQQVSLPWNAWRDG